MANLKITFYKGYPITPESEYAPYFDTSYDTAASVYAALQDYKAIEYNITGDFTPLQDYINVQEFANVDGCNYVRVEVVGEYTKYYYIKDIIALSQVERDGRYYRPAQVFLYEDIYLSNFYQATPTGKLKKPLISGNLVQCNQYANLQEYIRTPPLPFKFEHCKLISTNSKLYDDFCILVSYTDETGGIGQVVASGTTHKWGIVDLPSYVSILSGLAKLKYVIESSSGYQITTENNVKPLKMYILPKEWIKNYFYDFSDTIKSITAIDVHNAEISNITYLRGIQNIKAPLYVDTLTPEVTGEFADLTKYFFKTANNIVSIPWRGGRVTDTNKPQVDIYIEFSNAGFGADSISIFAMIGENLIDISTEFTVDTAVNEAALNNAQHKVSTAINATAGVVSSIGGVIGGIVSQNYFAAISSAIAGVKTVTDIYAGLETPAKTNITGCAAAAIAMYGGMTILKLEDPINLDTIKTEIYRHGYLYPEKPFTPATYLIGNSVYIKLENAIVNGNFGVDISRELQERFSRGIKFIRLEDI